MHFMLMTCPLIPLRWSRLRFIYKGLLKRKLTVMDNDFPINKRIYVHSFHLRPELRTPTKK